MYENMQKQRENNHCIQEAGQHVALAERGRPENERKQGRDDKRRQVIAYDEQGETGLRNGGHLRKAPVFAAAGPAQRVSRVTHGVDSRSRHSRSLKRVYLIDLFVKKTDNP
jgi:hypothetical protein